MKIKGLFLTLVLSLGLASTPAKADLDMASFARGVLFVGSAYLFAKTVRKENKETSDKALIVASIAGIAGSLLGYTAIRDAKRNLKSAYVEWRDPFVWRLINRDVDQSYWNDFRIFMARLPGKIL